MPSEDQNEEETFLVIGIDFGTSQSGVAWAFTTSPNDVSIISSWKADSKRSSDDEKCPSSISYDEDGNVTCWGFHTINDTGKRFQNFKLLLSQETRDDPKNKPLMRELAELEALDKKPVDVAADYLRCLWGHTLDALKNTSDRGIRLAIEVVRFKVVLTVPASWDHAAQDLTRRAATKAGILAKRRGKRTTLDMISEPEAAALAFFNDFRLKGQIDFAVGDSFVVCDAGGGTVDLISYKIENLDPLSLSMCSQPTGGPCGAVFLDDEFENQMRVSAGSVTFDDMEPRHKLDLMEKWEYGAKRVFRQDCNDAQKWSYYIGGRTAKEVLLSKGDLTNVFKPICSKAARLVRTQVQAVKTMTGKLPTAILLVGGFGENDYLREEIKSSFSAIKVQQLDRAISAICRGAVARGISDRAVLNHISRYNYGIFYAEPFVEGYHPQEHKIEDVDYPGTFQVHFMKWYLKKGQSIAHHKPSSFDFSKPFRYAKELEECKIKVYYSESLEPERYRTENVKQLCKIDAKFDKKLWDTLPYKPDRHMKYLKLSIVMEVTAGSLTWTILRGGQQSGEQRVDVIYE